MRARKELCKDPPLPPLVIEAATAVRKDDSQTQNRPKRDRSGARVNVEAAFPHV